MTSFIIRRILLLIPTVFFAVSFLPLIIVSAHRGGRSGVIGATGRLVIVVGLCAVILSIAALSIDETLWGNLEMSVATKTDVITTLLTLGSYTARIEKTTSAEVNGVPSDQATPWRRCRVCVRPSLEDSHRSASQGSSSKVDRLTRTRRPCMSVEIVSEVSSFTIRRLNDRGSIRMVATICPPRT